jgi:hypothetical protein
LQVFRSLTLVSEIPPSQLPEKRYVIHTFICFVLQRMCYSNCHEASLEVLHSLPLCVLAVEFVVILFFHRETKGFALKEVTTVFGENVVPYDVSQAASNTKGLLLRRHSKFT